VGSYFIELTPLALHDAETIAAAPSLPSSAASAACVSRECKVYNNTALAIDGRANRRDGTSR